MLKDLALKNTPIALTVKQTVFNHFCNISHIFTVNKSNFFFSDQSKNQLKDFEVVLFLLLVTLETGNLLVV